MSATSALPGRPKGNLLDAAAQIPLWATFAVAVAILFARDPAHVFYAELWGEDGWVWYPDAYHMGLRSFAIPIAGYLQIVSRLVGLAVQPFPLLWAPTLFAVSALLIQALPAVFLASDRMDQAWPHRPSRILFALFYLALPNSSEVYVNLTNAQWHLGVLAFLILVASPPQTRRQWAFDLGFLLLSALSGPFCLLLLPIAAVRVWTGWGRGTTLRCLALLAGASVQAWFVLSTVHERTMAPLGAGPRLLARIVVQQIMYGGLVGQASMPRLIDQTLWINNVIPVVAAAAGLVLVVIAVLRGPPLLRYFAAFAAAVLAGALLRPQAHETDAQWPLLALPGVGGRYWYIPMLAWLGVLFSLAAFRVPRAPWLRPVAAVLLCAFALGIYQDFRLPPRPETGFVAQAAQFRRAPPGTAMAFPVLPEGARPMQLVKRGS